MTYFIRRHMPWLSSVLIGMTLLAAGLFFLVVGLNAKAEIRRQLIDEQITTSQDASIPGVPVIDAKTAKVQADVIKSHTLGRWGPFSELPRDDPRRATFIDGVALRTSLNQAVMGFGITDMAIGAGIIIIVAGAATLVLAAPTLHYLAGIVVTRNPK